MSGGPLPTTILAVALIGQVLLHVLLPLRSIATWSGRVLGILLVALGLVLNLIADRQFKRARTPVSPRDRPTSLVTDGVFALSRNPMYVGMLVLLIGVAALLGSLTPLLVPAVFAWLVARMFIRPEEASLHQAFGAAYDQYARRVRRWV